MGQGHGRSKAGGKQERPKVNATLLKEKANKTQILFLGAGESGKSTIVKQAILQYGPGFDDKERQNHVRKIANNLIKGAAAIFDNSQMLGFSIKEDKVREAGFRIMHLVGENSTSNVDKLNDQIVDDILTLWEDDQFQETLKLNHLFQLEDTWSDFVLKLKGYPDKWGGPGWLPDDDDMLRARTMTVGYNSKDITLDDRKFVLIDVGGQRSERRKWLHIFKDIDAVIFVTALSEYNQTLFEAKGVNRLEESLSLFKKYSSMDEFKDSAFMLFLNKFDLFKIKYYENRQELVKPEIEGIEDPPKRENEHNEGCEFALRWFTNTFCSQTTRPKNEIYVHITTALNKKNIKFVLQSCKEFIFTRHLTGAGMMNVNDLSFHQED